MKNTAKDIELVRSWVNSPIKFIKDIWGYEPQPLICGLLTSPTHTHVLKCFGPFAGEKMITWQQFLVLEAVENFLRACTPEDRLLYPPRISVATGHGIGKTATASWLIHWFLFTRADSQIGCTAPTSSQMYDVLWKELAVWHYRLPPGIKDLFEWSTTHYKIKEKPETWWARARTASKEAPEAFAGLHATHILLLGDEASGVPNEIFSTAEGSLTGPNTLVLLFSNPTRLEGYFYDTHLGEDAKNWQHFSFDSTQSPIVKLAYVQRIISKYGEDSDEYRFRVLGQFPKAGGMQDGWLPLISPDTLSYVPDTGPFTAPKLGVDPAGAGINKTAHVIRDAFKAKVMALEDKSTPKSVAERTMTLMTHYNIPPNRVIIDSFGTGANVSQEIALADHSRVHAINVGDRPDDQERYTNIKSELYWRLREWLIAGGQLVRHPDWKQLLIIKYKRTATGKIQIMSKEEMLKNGYQSPDCAEALALSFYGGDSGKKGRDLGQLSDRQINEIVNIY